MPKKKKTGNKVNKSENALQDLDDIAKACLEIDQEYEFQRNRPKNKEKKKREEEKTTEALPENGRRKEDKNLFTMETIGQDVLDVSELKNCAELKSRELALISDTSEILISHLNEYGACVIDDFLGEELGNRVLQDVVSMGHLQRNGELASSRRLNASEEAGGQKEQQKIRGDKIAWTDGHKPISSPGIRDLMRILDSIIVTANRRENNGALASYKIKGRTKAMVACYPGEGTHYVTHIDNPSRDGRCITAIYYINQNWNAQADGGSLRIFSKGGEGPVAEIEPLFDRMLFFWSDRRNPHEVLPAFRKRYAVTLWYMDEEERAKYEEERANRTL